MIINIQDDILKLHSMGLLDKLLADKTTKQNILWATNVFSSLGTRYGQNEEITSELITGPNAGVIKTRARKAMEQQSSRTRQHGEVSTPLWVCKKMCDYADEARKSKASWQSYVDARVLEITCGEAPFLVSRYDIETGEAIPIPDRIGLLDRKLRAVNENTQTEEEWLNWTLRAFWAAYGYEFQGDNVLIARVNLLMTFEEYLSERWQRKPAIDEYKALITVIAWNIWQMDGLKKVIPFGTAEDEFQEIDWFNMLGNNTENNVQPCCRIKNWLGDRSVEFKSLPIIGGNHGMKFDFVIGNPPYQDETVGEQKTFTRPIYHLFIDASYKVANKVELIHPARFLFNAGSTPKAWNQKMLSDSHLKVLHYEREASRIFNNTEIKGGVAITYHDDSKDFGAIGTFTAYPELNSILQKVHQHQSFSKFSSIVITRTAYRLTDKLHSDYPQAISQLSEGHAYDMSTNIFERLSQVFFDDKPQDEHKYIQILGREGNDRVYKFIRVDYVNRVINLPKFKIILPAASGNGVLGETLTSPIICGPNIGSTESFISIGSFESIEDTKAALKFIKTKFVRILLGVLKVTQHITPEKWDHVPLQDFTSASDIDWTKPISEIDQQLYAKYGLDETEIQFIETHVKEMT